MKKNIINIIGIITIILITFYACKKDNDKTNYVNNQTEVPANLDDYLIEFKEKIKSAERSNNYLSIEDAEWHLTALQNFELCDASNFNPNMIIDTFYTSLKIKNDSISLFELNKVFEENVHSIKNKYDNLDGESKSIYYIHSKIEDNSKDGLTKVMTVSAMVNNNMIYPNPDSRFGLTDYWYACFEKGKCGEYEGEYIGRDACTEIDGKLQYLTPTYTCPNGRVYFTNIVNITINGLDTYCENSPFPYYCLYVSTTGYDDCLSPDDMNWYFDKILEILNENIEIYNRNLVYCKLRYDWTTDTRYTKVWFLDLKLADVNCTSSNPNI